MTEVDLGFGSHDFEELNAAEDGDLVFGGHDSEDLLLVDGLDGYAVTGVDVASVVDLVEGSMAKELSNLKSAFVVDCGMLGVSVAKLYSGTQAL
ncbi:hypothetical protein PIB30_017660 [Stylosanthes scabra]|uniref:Uncharacterized protein n=1 Tax=Stylosanthes scabra TaxID=79078 RepID=A0ABU6Y5X1_9FABA|nr:hypothetical protein [Stylosanthes scabra]